MGFDFKIEGKLINLRTTTRSDLADYERWNNPKLKAFQLDGPWYEEEEGLGKVINWREKWLGSERSAPYPFLEIETKKGIHVGWVVLYHSQRDPHASEFGISIYEDEYWGKGIGTEAAHLWVDYLFGAYDHLTRLGCCTWEGNKGMIHIGEKLGFIEEARIRKSCEVNGLFYDKIRMGILRSEWDRVGRVS
jgi:RimJ/RimL family protein N-acetyltransferase